MKYKWVLLIVIIICLITLCIVLEKPVETLLADNHLLPEPETFTELYFENHENLPSRVEAGETYTFAFSVHSEEYRDMTYPYDIYVQTAKKRIPIASGIFSLVQDQKRTFNEKFTAPAFTNRAEVVVDLVSKNQQIDFWIND